MEAILIILGIAFLLIAALLYGTLSWGWVLFKFWAWFVIPVFSGAPEIGYLQAVGLMFMINLFDRHGTHIKDEYTDNSKLYTSMILGPWVTLILAWIVRGMVM